MEIDIKNKANVVDVSNSTPAVAEEVKLEKKSEKVEPVVEVVKFRGRRPADWLIIRNADNSVSCGNSLTQETFEGTMSEFNSRMRG